MTDERLAELGRLCAASSGVAWYASVPEPGTPFSSECRLVFAMLANGQQPRIARCGEVIGNGDADADLIVAAKNALPELIAEVRRLRRVGEGK